MKKALMVTPDGYPFYNEMFTSSLEKMGYDVNVIETSIGLKKKDYINRIRRFLGCDLSEYMNKQVNETSRKILKEFEEIHPELVFVQFGMQVSREAICYMNQTTTTVLYLTDTIDRYEGLKKIIPCYKYVISYEADDRIKQYSINGYQLMLGSFDENIYKNYGLANKKIDVSFVGNMYGFRKEILEQLCKDFPGLNMQFYGVYQSKKNIFKYLLFLCSSKRRFFVNKKIDPKQVNEVYNNSKIVLNLQHPQSKNGWCSRTTEILGSGSFELISWNPMIEKMCPDGMITFRDYGDLKKKIEYYLEHEDEREIVAKTGNRFALENHTNSIALARAFRKCGII